MTTWRELLIPALEGRGETWDDIRAITLTEEELDVEFDCGYGGTEGIPFTVWTDKWVYFPLQYDGAEWVGSVPRTWYGMIKTHHKGGG